MSSIQSNGLVRQLTPTSAYPTSNDLGGVATGAAVTSLVTSAVLKGVSLIPAVSASTTVVLGTMAPYLFAATLIPLGAAHVAQRAAALDPTNATGKPTVARCVAAAAVILGAASILFSGLSVSPLLAATTAVTFGTVAFWSLLSAFGALIIGYAVTLTREPDSAAAAASSFRQPTHTATSYANV